MNFRVICLASILLVLLFFSSCENGDVSNPDLGKVCVDNIDCSGGLICQSRPGDNVCVETNGIDGAACYDDGDCNDGLRCGFVRYTTVCVTTGDRPGDYCISSAGDDCDINGVVCAIIDGSRVCAITDGAPGSACGNNADCTSSMCDFVGDDLVCG